MIAGMGEIESKLESARQAAGKKDPKGALIHLVAAHGQARAIAAERRATLQHVKAVWEKGHHPKGRSFEGKPYVRILDDTKDFFADRRADLSFMTAPEESIGLEEWARRLWSLIEEYAAENGVPVPAPADVDWGD
jgi:hypothetical protein